MREDDEKGKKNSNRLKSKKKNKSKRMEEVRWYPNSSTADATRENTQTLIFIIHTSLNNNFSTPADAEIMVAAIPHL